MSLVPKITRFTKLPELLKHKQEAEEKQKKGRQDRKDKERPPFVMEDEVAIHSQDLSEFKVQTHKKEPQKPKTKDETIGGHIDLQA
ncbi:MAG: hypothetical protein JJ953_12100 [Gracilimonas sp.]|uniref:hypothetical protein n=1 Tax=Gracilimonas TaxID=649462 RepID=UPI001B0EEB11|nr:hypothetical protein [Gracilimonas sp.]MBO6586840.1 hypothetical protein [Gracilimonas sp.]MBO6614672.1 hypothetical protein [Gracilimonas sp.]